MPRPAASEPPAASPTEARPVLLGVCAHLAGRLRIAPAWPRVGFVVLTLSTPWAALAYVLARLLIRDPATAGLSAGERLREEARQVGEQLSEQLGELRDDLARRLEDWSDRRADPRPLIRWRAGLGALLLGGGALLLLHSFDLLTWLTPGRSLAVAIVLIGFALLRPAA